ncbi:winged helix-turn-helix transcriptional regulator [Candidatus Woesearchaeota archaeon]|nr:winged helix-turn-helix transcriptional regulator [Candidatus Woesearchaeota archaeon]
MFEKELAELGLTDNESKIYLLLLQEGTLNPSDIAKKLGLHRGYVYDALERMQEKEVVSSILQQHKKHYQAINPKQLAEQLRFRLDHFEQAVPDLLKLSSASSEETTIELHKGRRVYRTLIKDITTSLEKNSEVLLIGIDERTLVEEIEPIYMKQYLTRVKELKIYERIIVPNGTMRLKSANFVYRHLDPSYIGNTAQIIYGESVALFIMGNPHYLMVIHNKKTADTYRKQFELLWKCAMP